MERRIQRPPRPTAARRSRVRTRPHPPRVQQALPRSVSAPNKRPRKGPYRPIFDRENDVNGLPAEPPACISSLIKTRRFPRVSRYAERRIQQGARRSVNGGQERLNQAG